MKPGSRVAAKTLINYLKGSGYDTGGIRTYRSHLKVFTDYVDQMQDNIDYREIDDKFLRQFLVYIRERISLRTGKKYSSITMVKIFGTVKLLFKALYVNGYILQNPTMDIKFHPKDSKRVKETLSMSEMNEFLDSIEPSDAQGLRNRAIFELMYSSGLRVSETAKLDAGDIDFENRIIHIRSGKFRKDRYVPVNEAAMAFLKKYAHRRCEGAIFKGTRGRLGIGTINRIFKKLLKRKDLYREGLSTHSIRHCTATHLLSSGADLRYVQELLGHESIETTVVYTHELKENIKKIYRSYHPRENGYYKEVDSDYMERLQAFKKVLERQRKRTIRRRELEKKKNGD
ncbi:MAG: tyrosine-type recombinase/integrase [Spirochaetales bacterium]|nr:tyrosine-type recombinase/integrase [Spirochaetales bacterium]